MSAADSPGFERFHVAILFVNLGGYHLARLRGAQEACDRLGWRLTAVQVTDDQLDHPWGELDLRSLPPVVTLLPSDMGQRDIRKAAFGSTAGSALTSWLAEVQPDAVLFPGWSLPFVHAGLRWCLRAGAVPILMSESTADDARRVWWREWTKGYIVRNFRAALVGGAPHRAYLERLGMAPEAIFSGYDIIDNAYFAERAEAARAAAGSERGRLNLPRSYFLASSRFIAKKNLFRLIDAYAEYRTMIGSNSWDLIILGDGDQRRSLFARRETLALTKHLHFPGFTSYADLPSYYAFCSAFIHASTTEQWGLVVNEAMACRCPVLVSNRCGCARDLVRNASNGFTFEPTEVPAIANAMCAVTAASDAERDAMGEASFRIISAWDKRTFGEGFVAAVNAGLQRKLSGKAILRRVFLAALGRRNSTARH